MKIETGEQVDDANALDLANIVKQFIRELPDPLLTARLQECFLRCHHLPEQIQVQSVLLLCALLPPRHLALLRYAMQFFRRVASRSLENKMDSSNISVCLAPNVFRIVDPACPSLADGKFLLSQTAIVKILIEHSSDIGMVSDDLANRVSLMSTFFSDYDTENELDFTDGKEKKRSGSFQGNWKFSRAYKDYCH